MKNRLSHSAVGKLMQCGKSYEYHYIKKIRSKFQSAALVFGSAIDLALNELLIPTGNSAEEIFINKFTNTSINGKDVYVQTNEIFIYQTRDMDIDLLTQDDLASIKDYALQEVGTQHTVPMDICEDIKKRKTSSGYENLNLKDQRLFNFINWLCLKQKGLLMIEAYRKKVLPKIEKVHAVQKQVSLINTDGDSVVGYVDLIADIKDIGTVILDNKTAGQLYEKDSVLTSPQLSLYVHMLEEEYQTRLAGYIVLLKDVVKNKTKICSKCGYDGTGGRHKTCDSIIDGKRCNGDWNETISPEIYVQFITDEIPKQTETIVLENMDTANSVIKSGNFTRNFNNCHNHFGSRCPYFSLCYYNKMEGLVDMNEPDI